VAVAGLRKQKIGSASYRIMHFPLSITQILFVCWLAVARSDDPQVRLLTLPIFIGMLTGLLWCLGRLRQIAHGPNRLVTVVLGLYAGWSTSAIWLNLATLLPRDLLEGAYASSIQGALVCAAAVSAVIGSNFTGRNVAYVMGALWALAGVLISSIHADLLSVAGLAGAGSVILLGEFLVRFNV
jgi:hypothetical protein